MAGVTVAVVRWLPKITRVPNSKPALGDQLYSIAGARPNDNPGP